MREHQRAYEVNTFGHEWVKNDDDGSINIFAFNPSRFCNGPLCIKCGYGFCHHCQKLPTIKCYK